MLTKKIVAILIVLVFVAGPCFADFRFAVIGDTRGNNEDGINIEIMKIILEKIKSEKVDFIVVVGDMITGSAKSRVHMDRLKKWKSIIKKYQVPFYIALGNHEVESELSENTVRLVFEMPGNGPAGFKELVYSFDYKNTHFVVLDTDIFNNFHRIGERQLEWLRGDLEKNKDKNIFVFGHEPAYPAYGHIGSSLDKYASDRDELWGVFGQYNVRAYFCGHEHLYNKAVHDGIYQIITGGGGAPLAAPEKGGFYNFAVVDVKSDGAIDVTVKDAGSSIRDNFSIEY